MDPHYNIIEKEGGVIVATPEGGVGLNLIINNDGDSRAFNRKAIKLALDGKENRREGCLVGELNGVRVYIRGGSVLMTTQDIKL